jgi:hypothetical protein
MKATNYEAPKFFPPSCHCSQIQIFSITLCLHTASMCGVKKSKFHTHAKQEKKLWLCTFYLILRSHDRRSEDKSLD